MTKRAPLAAVLFLLASSAASIMAGPAASEPVVGDLSISGTVVYRDTSFMEVGNITVLGGGDLTLDNTSILMRLAYDEALQIRVNTGGTLRIVNGSSISSAFQTVAYSLHYRVFIEPGGHLVLQNSSLDYPYWIGVGDESAVIEDSNISHSLMGLFGSNLTVSRMTFFSNMIGFWLSGSSVVRDSSVDTSDVYGGILDGDSVAENISFRSSLTADLALLDRASAINTTHLSSARGVIALQNSSVLGATMANISIAGVQLGDEDFRYGCGIFVGRPQSEWLNMHLFTYFYRTNNSVTLRDLSVSNAPRSIAFANEVWRRDNDTAMDTCIDDPPPRIVGLPLWNRINLTVTRPTALRGAGAISTGRCRSWLAGRSRLRAAIGNSRARAARTRLSWTAARFPSRAPRCAPLSSSTRWTRSTRRRRQRPTSTSS